MSQLKKNELTVDEAKEKFRASLMEFDPVRIIRKKPLHAVGAVAFAGLLMGYSGRKFLRAFMPGPQVISSIIKKII